MPRELFVDTGAWLAILNPRDNLHSKAAAFYPGALREFSAMITTNLVVAETYALVQRRCGVTVGLSFLDLVDSSSRILKICSSNELEAQARDWLARYRDQDLSFVGAVSFAVMQSRALRKAFAFDEHFRIAGFECVP